MTSKTVGILTPSNGSSSSKDITDLDMSPEEADALILLLRKPTELKAILETVPKPVKAVPKGGLPIWYKLGLECKLPVPKVPKNKIVLSRGKLGEDIRKITIPCEGDNSRPSFDLTDPYCNNVNYDYEPVHDPHLSYYFRQKAAIRRMKSIGFATKDGRAICTLKEFNTFRQYLYNRYMDRIHMVMAKRDERAKDDITIKRVTADVARRQQAFFLEEKSRAYRAKHAAQFADEYAEKLRKQRDTEKRAKARLKYLIEFNERRQKERAARSAEKSYMIRRRVQAAAELELRRKFVMVRNWRLAEKRRQNRLKALAEAKIQKAEEDANEQWNRRIKNQNRLIQESNWLLKMYTDDMRAAAHRRLRKAEIHAFGYELKLAAIRLTNLKAMHGGAEKHEKLIRKVGTEFEKGKRGGKGMSIARAHQMAKDTMKITMSTDGDALVLLGQTRQRMDLETVVPVQPVEILDEILEAAVVEFARRRVHLLLRNVEHGARQYILSVVMKALKSTVPMRQFPTNWRAPGKQSKSKSRTVLLVEAVSRSQANRHKVSNIVFGEVNLIANEEETDIVYKRTKDRPPTPVPSKTLLADVTFSEKLDDLADPVANPLALKERRKILDMVRAAARLISRSVLAQVQDRIDLTIASVSLPNLRHKMEFGEVVEALSDAVVNNRIQADCGDVRRASLYLTYRILQHIRLEIVAEKKRMKEMKTRGHGSEGQGSSREDFYTPGRTKSGEKSTQDSPTMNNTAKPD